MHTSAGLAKKIGLERYLDKPDELNELILNLLLLQETLQLERARKKRRDDHQAATISIRRNAYGKFIAASIGDERYRYAVETALKASTEVLAVFQRGKFLKVLRSMGVPEERGQEFSNSLTIDDDTHCIDPE